MHKHSTSGLTAPSHFAFDAVVIGSGFGGGTLALRLTQAGKRVLVLERGRRWRGQNIPAAAAPGGSHPFPALGDDRFFWGRRLWDPRRQRLGLFDVRQFLNLQGVMAAGVGGGSLIWTNVVIEAPADVFTEHWPKDVTRSTLEPYYKKAEQYLRPAFVPGTPGIGSATTPIKRVTLLKEAAECVGKPWRPVRVAVNFSDESEPSPNGFGQAQQLGCNFCARCAAGCPQNAKNTVDLSYIAEAESLGAEVRTLHRVCHIAALANGYRVYFERFNLDGQLVERDYIDAAKVILAAGTFGTTELLLKSKMPGLLPNLSAALGTRLSINGNVLSGAIRKSTAVDGASRRAADNPDRGTAIASMIDYGNFVVEDFANPAWAAGIVGGTNFGRIAAFVKALLGVKVRERERQEDLLVYVGVGRDRARGRMFLNALGQLNWRWPGGIGAEPVVRELHAAMAELARVQGRDYVPNVFSIFNRPVIYHPLGGCPMADTAQTGVVDSLGRVYGYPGLYIADGSIVPTALGRNPAFTIAALAERIAEHAVRQWDCTGAPAQLTVSPRS